MDRAVRDRWVRALRSGRYKQTKGLLQRTVRGEQRNCCLGVLCRVLRVDPRTQNDFGERNKILGPDLANRVGISRSYQSELASRNDTGSKFPRIADWIEENL